MAPMGRLLRMLLRIPVVLTLNGKELTYQNSAYLKVVAPSIGRMDYLTAISSPTASLAARAFPEASLEKIVLGSTDRFYDARGQQAVRDDLAKRIGVKLADKKILYTSGRLIRRKGVLWFVSEVLPKVIKAQPDVIYAVVGKGEDYEALEGMVKNLRLENYVYLLGYVDDAVRNLLYNAADLFIMPNIPVRNDMEGLGLVAMEASSCGTPIIGSNLEGVQDAIVAGETGYLLPPKDAKSYVARINAELDTPTLDRVNVRKISLKTYDWDKTADEYIEVFRRAISSYKN